MDLESIKDIIIIALGGGAAWKGIAFILSKLKNGTKNQQSITVNSGNGNNGRVYATKEELSKHALNCAGAIHEKINSNYEKLSTQIHGNHKETMKVFADMKVDIAKLQSIRGCN